ncbi:MAG: acyl carrier protein [Clostridia bacterium]|nr:acyl carrier protein [Clostridia bacterium]MBR6779654.1 acyl carrier protein [Clostridia bacterium]
MLEELKTLISDRLGIPAAEITAKTDLLYELGADSLTLVSLVGDVEDHFDISIDDTDLAQLATVGDLADLIDRLKA